MNYVSARLRLAFLSFLTFSCVTASVSALADPSKLTEEVVVRAHPLSAEGLSQPVSVLAGEALTDALGTSLGETLGAIPGVHSASFGQAVGRPVIRGLGGPRVKTLEDRIDSLDVSVSSPDHATTIEPFIANSIEVLKGPSTLVYGSGSIGGVVDVHTGRVPHLVPDKVTGRVEMRGTDNADQRTVAGRADGGQGNFAFHIDGFYRDANDFEIPGFAESARQRAREEAEGHGAHDDEHGDEDHDEHGDEDHDEHGDEDHDEHGDEDHDEHGDEDHDEHGDEHHEEEEAFGLLPGSSIESQGGSFGVSWVSERSFIGVAVSTFEAKYGLPGHSHAHHDEHGDEHGDEDHDEHGDEDHDEHSDEDHDEHGEEMPPILDLEQTRIDLEAGFENPFDGIRNVNVRIGYNDYEHIEVEGDEGGTIFATKSWESRIELTHEALLGFEGAIGLQLSNREFSALGEEAFVLPVDTRSVGAFWVGQQDLGDSSLEVGFRYETVDQDPLSGRSKSFNLGSASVGMIRPLSEHWTISGQLDYSSRAPIAEELYSNGAHLATQTFEIGNENLSEETAVNVSADLRYRSEALFFSLSGYSTEFGDYIYEANTGLEEDELPVLLWSQGDASFSGVELEASWQAISWENGGLSLKGGFDSVRGQLDEGSDRDLPRIPPQRWRIAGTLDWSDFQAEISWASVSDQNDTYPWELQTDGYDDLRASLSYVKDFQSNRVELFVKGRNLTDDEQRQHTSFIGQLAPRAGRTVEVGFRLSF